MNEREIEAKDFLNHPFEEEEEEWINIEEEYFDLEELAKKEVRIIIRNGILDCIQTGADVPTDLEFVLVDFDVEGQSCDPANMRYDSETESNCIREETHADDGHR